MSYHNVHYINVMQLYFQACAELMLASKNGIGQNTNKKRLSMTPLTVGMKYDSESTTAHPSWAISFAP